MCLHKDIKTIEYTFKENGIIIERGLICYCLLHKATCIKLLT